jgi:hypothetical protein
MLEGDMPPEVGAGEPSQDITVPQEAPPAPGADKPLPLTSKGEEYLCKMAYLALLYTPKGDEVMRIKNMFEQAGIHDENAIQAEQPEIIQSVKDIITNILGTNNSSDIADKLNTVESPNGLGG